MSPVPVPPAPLPVDDYVGLPRVSAARASPDGTWLLVLVQREDPERGRFRGELWRQPVDGGPAIRLLGGTRGVRAPAFRDDGALLFVTNAPVAGTDGKSLPQVHLLPAHALSEADQDALARPLSDEPWGVDDLRLCGDTLAVLAPALPGVDENLQRERWMERERQGPGGLHLRRGPPRWWDQWLGATATRLVLFDADGAGRRVTAAQDPWAHVDAEWDLSADGRWLVLTCDRPGPDRITDRALLLIEVATGDRRLLGAHDRWQCSAPRLDAHGTRLAARVHARVPGGWGRVRLALWELRGGAQEPAWLHEGEDLWMLPRGFQGEDLVCEAQERGRQRAWALSGDGRARPLTPLRGCLELQQVLPEGLVALEHDLLRPPAPALVGADGARRAIPRPLPSADLAGCCCLTELELPSADGAPVHTLVVWPGSRPPDGPLPALLWVHGGPVAQWADQWHWRWNAAFFASWGYAVVLPNPRGSTGYGHAWVEAITGNRWGEACADDVLAVLAAMRRDPRIDPDRIAAVGASFGGWMVNLLGGRTTGLRCIVSHAGIFDHRAMAGSTDTAPTWAWEQDSAPWTDPAHDRWSPHRGIAAWTAPTLVIHGERDYRVPIEQGLSLFEALQQHGVQAELLAFPEEGHHVLRPRAIRDQLRVVLDFLARHCGGTPPGPPPVDTGW